MKVCLTETECDGIQRVLLALGGVSRAISVSPFEVEGNEGDTLGKIKYDHDMNCYVFVPADDRKDSDDQD